jgi:hypothetical protein
VAPVATPRLHGTTLNAYFLFHGAPLEVIESTCEVGFDPRRGGTNAGKLFGVGAYFVESASKSDRYTTAGAVRGGGKTVQCVLLARVPGHVPRDNRGDGERDDASGQG